MFKYGKHLVSSMPHMKTTKAHIVTSITVWQFAYSFSGIFVPIYLYTIGLTLAEIAMYYILQASIKILLQERAAYYIHKYGVHHSLVISYILSAFYFLALYSASISTAGIIISSIFGALMNLLFWNSRHIELAHLFRSTNMGKSNSGVIMLSLLAAALAPIIGGIIAQVSGPETVLLVSFSVFMIAISIVHKELGSEKTYKYDFNLKVPFKEIIPDVTANVGMNFQAHVGAKIWPLYVFILLGSFSQVGIIFGIGMASGMLLTYFVGRYLDRSQKNIIPIGSVVRAIMHGLKLFASSIGSVLVINMAGDLSDAIVGPPYLSAYYINAKKFGIGAYVFSMETIGSFGMLLAWSCLGLFSLMYTDKTAFLLVFALAVPMSLLMSLLKARK